MPSRKQIFIKMAQACSFLIFGYEIKDDIVDMLMEKGKDEQLQMYRASNSLLAKELKEMKEIESHQIENELADNNNNIMIIVLSLIIIVTFLFLICRYVYKKINICVQKFEDIV